MVKATRLYGISNCDTVKKARKWLEAEKIPHEFVDFRVDGLSAKQVKTWIADLGLDQLVNKRSTTWKNLTPAQQQSFEGGAAVDLIVANPTLIKRPLIEIEIKNGELLRQTGFKSETYLQLFS